jgi:hypothetical protein
MCIKLWPASLRNRDHWEDLRADEMHLKNLILKLEMCTDI